MSRGTSSVPRARSSSRPHSPPSGAPRSDQEQRNDADLRNLSEVMLKNGQVVLATSNLYARCCKRSSMSHPPDESNPIHQLEIVGHFVSDLGKIIKDWRSRQ